MANLRLRRDEGGQVPTRGGGLSPGGVLDPFRLMESLLRWNVFNEMAPFVGTRGGGQIFFMPAFEVCETKDSYVIKADMPGVKESDLDICLMGNQLTIAGKREVESQEDVQNFYAYECSYGSFTRSFTIPQGADPNNVRADLKDGVLTLVLPKRPEMQPRKISLGAGGQAQPTGKKANA